MRIKELEINNMFCFGNNQVLRFDKPVYQVVGIRDDNDVQSNGTGKSSIYYVIQEILFGKNSKDTLKAYTGNIYTNPNSYSGRLDFKHAGKNYSITLSRTSGKVKLLVLEDGKDISESTVPKNLKLIERLLGVDYDLFTMLTYISPTISTPNILFFGTPKEKRDLFVKLFNLQEITEKTKKARSVYSELNSELRGIETTIKHEKPITIPKTPVRDSDIDKIPELEKEVQNLNNVLANELVKQLNLYKEGAKIHREIEKLEAELSELDIPEIVTSEEIEKLVADISKAEGVLAGLKKEYSKLAEVTEFCPTCGSRIKDYDHIDAHRKEIKARIDKGTAYITELKTTLKGRRHFFETSQKKLKIEERLKYLNQRLQDLNIETVNPDEIQNKIEEIKQKISSLESKIQELRKKDQEYQKAIHEIEVLTKLKVQQENKIAELRKKEEEIRGNLVYYEIIVKHLDSDYLQLEISSMLDAFTQLINEYLFTFSNNTLMIKLADNKKITFLLLKDNKELPVNNLSAGQLTILQLSTILALRDLINARQGISIDLLVLDELFGTLDQLRRSVLTDLMRTIGSQHKILSISHLHYDPAIPTIIVKQKNGVSEIQQ